MERFEFIVANQGRITIDAQDKLEAMGIANERFDLPQGAWVETPDTMNSSATGYRWAEGNFFD